MKKENDKDFEERFEKRRKRARKKELFSALLLLLPPCILACGLLFASIYTRGLSFFFLYFILPMFYTVEKRIRCLVSGIGNPKFSYADGYRAFFQENQAGIFGVIFSLIGSFVIGRIRYFLRYSIRVPLLNCFPAAKTAFKAIQEAYAAGDAQNLTLVINQNRGGLCQPLSIVASLIFFLPIFYLFFNIDRNLSNHYVATIVLPDIDKNISSGQARNLAKGSFASFTAGFRRKKYFTKNWPYLVGYALVYGLTIFGVSNIETNNSNLVLLIRRITPRVGFLLFLFLNVFILINSYAVIEESQERILNSLPPTRKVSIYQTYCNPNYIHGEESARRGCFVPADQGSGSNEFYSPFNESNPFAPDPENTKPEYKPEDNPQKPEAKSTRDEDPIGGVFDFTKDKKDDDK